MQRLIVVMMCGVLFSACTVGEKQISTIVVPTVVPTMQMVVSPTPSIMPIPARKVLVNDYHIFQTFNNCGPASLSMALSYFGVNVSQHELGEALRPYQVASGVDDDKSVTLEELASKAREYGLSAYQRVGGSVELVERLVALDLPVVTRTWLKEDDDIGHYRVVKGYDQEAGVIVQDDSYQGKNLQYSVAEFDEIWRKFGYEFLVLVPKGKEAEVEQVLGELVDEQVAWRRAVDLYEGELAKNPQDVSMRLQLSVALYHVGDYARSVAEFEQVEAKLPFRTLWYQIEPIQAYFELGDDVRVMEITDRVLNNGNRAFSELYEIRGRVWEREGKGELARGEFEKQLIYIRKATI